MINERFKIIPLIIFSVICVYVPYTINPISAPKILHISIKPYLYDNTDLYLMVKTGKIEKIIDHINDVYNIYKTYVISISLPGYT